jgi:hypothetical protein
MPVDFLPGTPSRPLQETLSFGMLPLTHLFTLQDTGPTSAYIPGTTPGLGFFGHPPPAWHTVGICSEK